jgi:hypothetical protein
VDITATDKSSHSKLSESSLSKLENGVRQLEDMGFKDDKLNKELMLKYDGDVMRAVQELLNFEMKKS